MDTKVRGWSLRHGAVSERLPVRRTVAPPATNGGRNYYRAVRCFLLTLALALCYTQRALPQYFGQNKINYRAIDFSTKVSPHFQLYHYTNDASANAVLQKAEKWYGMHQRFLQEDLEEKNPLILYNNHGDFQQTTVLNTTVPVGTGGFTEGLKNRVVIPLSEHSAQNSHVLGHELVHAFQYHMIKHTEPNGLARMGNLPLWLVEGMAEFMSLGRVDSHTSMWIRDALLHDYFPSIKQLEDRRYFPYRYGHSFWAFATGLWGDAIIKPFFLAVLRDGLEKACQEVLGYNLFTLSKMWRDTNANYYAPYMKTRSQVGDIGEPAIDKKGAGNVNVLPSVSPDGRYMITLSDRDVIAQDYILIDLENSAKIRKIGSLSRSHHIDFITSYESAATWSPDSKRIALVVYKKGKNVFLIIEASSGDIVEDFSLEGLPSFSHPSWSPDGRYIALSGLKDGKSDIYLVDMEREKRLTALTHDIHSDTQPSWSPDGKAIVFSTDRPHPDDDTATETFHLALLSLEAGGTPRSLDLFRGGNHLNPRFVDNEKIIFLSNRDGTTNLYQHDRSTEKLTMLTNYVTGISGITKYAQAMDFCPRTGTVFYNVYENQRYLVVRNSLKDFLYLPVEKAAAAPAAGILPPVIPLKEERITEAVSSFLAEEETEEDFQSQKYKPKFGLKNVSNSGVGIGVGSFGFGASGGLLLQFDDVLSNHEILTLVSINGEIYDIALGVNYLHKKGRIGWGVALSHIPFLYRTYTLSKDTLTSNSGREVAVENFSIYSLRTFEEKATFMVYYPLSIAQRVEGSLFGRYYNYYYMRNNQYYQKNTFYRSKRETISAPDSTYFLGGQVALVGDNTSFGVVGPLRGLRYRLEFRENMGTLHFQEVNLDLRRYWWYRPLGFAFRAMHLGRYGKDAENRRFLYPLNVAFPHLIHGYNYLQSYKNTSLLDNDVSGGFFPSSVLGSRMAVANAELRLPLTGIERLTLIKANFHTELAVFFDVGYAWSSASYAETLFGSGVPYTREPIVSTGLSLRVNLFGIILEPYYAIPFQREDVEIGTFGFNFLIPSW